jgi:uncharacterized protein YdcH (DUF465 family)
MTDSIEDISSSHLQYDYKRLTREHAALNQRIASLLNEPEPAYQPLILALKRLKLGLKDQMTRLPRSANDLNRWRGRNKLLFDTLRDVARRYRPTRLAVAA